MKKRILSILLAVLMVITVFPITVFANDMPPEDAVAYVTNAEGQPVGEGDNFGTMEEQKKVAGYYKTLHVAINACPGNKDNPATEPTTITMLSDIGTEEAYAEYSQAHANTVQSGQNIVLDLNGCKVYAKTTVNGETCFIRVDNGGTLTIKDNKTGGCINYIDGNDNAGGFVICSAGKFTLESGTLENKTTCKNSAIQGAVDVHANEWGTAYTADTEFVMTGGALRSQNDNTLRAYDSSQTGSGKVKISVNISSGEITGADAVFVMPQWTKNYDVSKTGIYMNPITVTVSGGTFTTTNGIRVAGNAGEANEKNDYPIDINVTGGTFITSDTAKYRFESVAFQETAGWTSTEASTKNLRTYAKINSKPATSVASIGTTYYTSLAEAVENVNDGETITLLKDSNVNASYTKKIGDSGYDEADGANRLVISNGKTFTLDLGGNTLTGRINISNAKINIQNGTIKAVGQPLNMYGIMDASFKDKLYTYVNVASNVAMYGDYGVCVLPSTTAYTNTSYGVKVDFYGTSYGCSSVNGQCGNDKPNEWNSALPDGITAPSKAMSLYGPEINIYGKMICDDGPAFYLAGMARINVFDGAELKGTEAISMKSGVVNIYGGTLTSTGEKQDPVQAVNSGEEASGAAISVTTYYTNDTYEDRADMVVNIFDGTIKGGNNSALLVTHSYKNNSPVAAKQGIALNIANGKFSSGDGCPTIFVDAKKDGDCNTYPTGEFISGGYYTDDVSKYVAKGYVCINNEDASTKDAYPYIVTVAPTKVEVKEEAAKVVTTGENADTIDSKIGKELAGEVKKDVVEKIIENASETSTSNIQEQITEEKVQVKDNEATKEVELSESSKTRIDVKLESIQINVSTNVEAPTIVAECTVTTKTATYDVKPVVTITKTNDETGETTVESFVITNDWLEENNKVLTFTLPVPDSMTGDSVLVKHIKENNEVETFNARVETKNDKRFITINATEFSTYELSQQTEENATAKIENGGKTYYYSSLANAISDAQSGDTITLLKDSETGTITVDRVVTFTLVLNGNTLKATIKPGDDYVRHIYGDKYYFELYEAGDTIVIGGKKDKDTKTETKEENPETGAPVLSMSTGIAVLCGAAFILSKKK